MLEKKMSNKKDKASHTKHAAGHPAEEKAVPMESVADNVEVSEAAFQNLAVIEELQKQLAEAQSLVVEYKDGWQRAVADFQNYKRRIDTESKDTYQNAVGNILRRYLPILDDLERALAHRPADLPWADGIELIYRKLQTILENEGLKRIEAEGQPFDPNYHEAISQEPAEGVECGIVIGVVQQGYMLGERVIRPAMVRVAQ
jgi:molecular chaperone GrpE